MLLRAAEGSEGHGGDDAGPEQGLIQNLEAKGKRKKKKINKKKKVKAASNSKG